MIVYAVAKYLVQRVRRHCAAESRERGAARGDGLRPIGVYHRVGYTLDRWHDVGWWQLILKQHESSPAAPLGLAAVCNRRGWRELLTRGESIVRVAVA